jgi:DNA-directed RNA polymerase subunit L
MEVEIVKKDKGMLLVELKGETKSFANLIREELWNDKNVEEASVIKDHPYSAEPRVFVKMKGRADPKKALKEAAKRIQIKLKGLDTEFTRHLKK